MSAVSIIVPVYNAEQYIENCINSILAQNFKDFELILVDDGSTDLSGEICDRFALNDKRVRVLHLSNAGVSSARNAGIEHSAGDFIMFCDSDDYVSPDWMEKLYNRAINAPDCLALGGYTIHDLRGKTGRHELITYDKESCNKADFFEVCLKLLFYVVWNKIFNAEIIKKNNLRFNSDISLGEDLLFCLDYLRLSGDKIYITPDCGYQYVLRERESLNYKYYPNLKDINIKLYSEIYSCMESFGTDMSVYSEGFYFLYLRMLTETLKNTMSPQNKMSYFEKIRYNNSLMQSDIYKTCLKNAGPGEYSKLFLMCLKTGYYPVVIFYKKLCTLKRILKKH